MWSLTRGRDSFSWIQMMLNPALSTLLPPHLPLTLSQTFSFALLCSCIPFPPSVSFICLFCTYLSHFSPPSIGSFPPYFSKDVNILPPAWHLLSPPPHTHTLSPFPSITPSFFLIFVRDKCAKALSSLSSLKRSLSSTQNEAESATWTSVLSWMTWPNPHTHRTLSQTSLGIP